MLRKLNKKHILSVVAVASSLVIANANAAVAGPYLGGQLGFGNVHQGGFSRSALSDAVGGDVTAFGSSSKSTGVAGRVFGGYQVNQNFAAEAGFTKFSNAKANATTTGEFGTLNTKGTIKTYAIDLVGKAIMPLPCNFNIYGKAGLAYLNEQAKVTASTNDALIGPVSETGIENASHIYPTFGAGVGYDVTKNIVADVSWNRIQKTGNSDELASTDLVAAGLSYNFG